MTSISGIFSMPKMRILMNCAWNRFCSSTGIIRSISVIVRSCRSGPNRSAGRNRFLFFPFPFSKPIPWVWQEYRHPCFLKAAVPPVKQEAGMLFRIRNGIGRVIPGAFDFFTEIPPITDSSVLCPNTAQSPNPPWPVCAPD